MVGDHFNQQWQKPYYQQIFTNIPEVSKKNFEALKREVESMKELLIRAKAYDEKNNEPNCEMDEKVAKLKEIAKLMGVSLDDVFKPKKE